MLVVFCAFLHLFVLRARAIIATIYSAY